MCVCVRSRCVCRGKRQQQATTNRAVNTPARKVVVDARRIWPVALQALQQARPAIFANLRVFTSTTIDNNNNINNNNNNINNNNNKNEQRRQRQRQTNHRPKTTH